MGPPVTMTQAQKILRWMQAGYRITPLEALTTFQCMRLGARIYDLRKEGHQIEERRVPTPSGKSVSEYWMLRPVPRATQSKLPLTGGHPCVRKAVC